MRDPMIRYVSGLFLFWSFVHFAYAETTTIYKFIDSNGVLHLTNRAPKKSDDVLYSRSYVIQSYQPPPPVLRSTKSTKGKQQYKEVIYSAALRHGVPAALLHAVIKVESGYNPRAVSPKGAVGLMQLMPETAKRYGVSNRTDPDESVEGGARYLRDLLDLFNEDISLALAAYNAGEQAVKRYGNVIPPFRETKQYVAQVTSWYRQFLQNM